MERNKEYDEFGPCIYEIDNENDVPGIFRSYYNRDTEYLLLFKVPRKIERRNASPGMDLYDYLVGASDEYLHILKRTGKKVNERKTEYNAITAMEDIHNLLDGKLIFFTREEPALIAYNTVSEEIIQKLINIIEKKINASAQKIEIESIPVVYEPEGTGSPDMHLFNLFNQLQSVNPEIRLAAYQSDIHIKITMELRKKLKSSNLKLSNTAFIIDDKELIVVERKSYRRRKKDIDGHYYSFLYLPFQSMTRAATGEFDNESNLLSVELSIYNHTFYYIIENGNNKILDLWLKLENSISG